MATGAGARRAALCGLLVLTAWLYAPTLTHGYQYEDVNWLEGRPVVWQVPSRALAAWSHAVVGDRPAVDHAINVALHLVNGALVAAVGGALASPAASYGAAAVFLLHPLNSAAVSYLTARTDLLMTLWVLLAVWVSLGSFAWWRLPLVLGACVLAAMSKEIGVVSLGLVALTAVLWSPSWRVPLAICAAVSLLLMPDRVWAWLSLSAPMGGAAVAWTDSLLLQNGMLWHLLSLVIWPAGFSIDHDVLALSPLTLVVSAALTLSTITLIALGWRRAPVMAWALAWGLASVGPRFVFRTSEWITEPQMLLSTVGISVLVGAGLAWLWSPAPRLTERTT